VFVSKTLASSLHHEPRCAMTPWRPQILVPPQGYRLLMACSTKANLSAPPVTECALFTGLRKPRELRSAVTGGRSIERLCIPSRLRYIGHAGEVVVCSCAHYLFPDRAINCNEWLFGVTERVFRIYQPRGDDRTFCLP
jgi:hypothetical protein